MSVRRDRVGIPHIRGASVLDLAREQGRVTAHDRAWQLEVERLRGEARVGALGGSAAWDAFACDLDIEGTARRGFDALPAESQEFVAAYVDNARSVALLHRLGAELGPVTEIPAPLPDLPAKRAQLAFVSRPGSGSSGA